MAYNGLNLENVKNQNRSSILKLLNDHGPMSRKDISARLGLTPASVTTPAGDQLHLPLCPFHQHRDAVHLHHPV